MDQSHDALAAYHDDCLVHRRIAGMGSDPGFVILGIIGHRELRDAHGSGIGKLDLQR
jgi:hypothetical protein